jgi:hypothetical protein
MNTAPYCAKERNATDGSRTAYESKSNTFDTQVYIWRAAFSTSELSGDDLWLWLSAKVELA